MMKMLKKAASAVLALAVIATALLSSGCSTPKIAMTVDGTEYTTGEYLAFLYNSFYNVYVNGQLYYYDLYYSDTYDVWSETYTYGDDDKTEYNLVDYIKLDTKETIIRQVAIKQMMDEYGITVSDEDKEEAETYLASMPVDAYIDYGFNNDSYARMYREYNLNERALFYTLYGESGQKAVAAEDIRTYFDDNYLSYKIISYSLVDDKGEALADKEIAAITADLDGYLKMFTDGASFDDVIAQYKKDTAAESATDATTSAGSTTTTAATTTTETTTTTAADTDADADKDSDTDKDAADTTTDANRVDIDSAQTGDAELVKALKEMTFGEAKIIEYSTDAGVKTKALALRLDPEADRGTDKDGNAVDYFADQHDTILYALKYDEFDEAVQAKKDSLTVEINETVVKKCDPYEFRTMFAG